jgi:hypothetical protein
MAVWVRVALVPLVLLVLLLRQGSVTALPHLAGWSSSCAASIQRSLRLR